MENGQEQYQTIVDYLENRLPEDQAEVFRQQLADDPALATEVAVVRIELEMGGVLFDREIEAQLAAWDTEDMGRVPAKKSPSILDFLKKNSGLFGLFIGLAVLSLLWWGYAHFGDTSGSGHSPSEQPFQSVPPDPENRLKQQENQVPLPGGSPNARPEKKTDHPDGRQYAALSKKDLSTMQKYLGHPFGDIRKTKSQSKADPLAAGIAAYQKGNFSIAVIHWDSVARLDNDYSGYARHYMAYAELQLALKGNNDAAGHLDNAFIYCNLLLKNYNYELIWPSTEWALMMVYLAKDGKKNADFLTLLEKMKQSSEYAEKARKLEEELKD